MNPSTSTSGVVTRRSSSCFLFDFPEADLESKLASDEDSLAASHICIRGSRSSESLVADSTERSSFVKSVLPRIANFTGRHVLRNSEVCDNSGTSHSSAHNSTNTYERTSIAGFPSQSITDQTSSNTLPVLFPFTESSAGNVIKNGNDYLNVAAQFISAAQKAESETAFELAFQCYKGAVKVLLQGVQLERDLSKRNRVRKKTAKYLLKAEKLYRSYLSFDGSAFEATSWLSTAIQDPSLLAFQSSNSLLKTYRVIDILPFFTARNRVFVVENTLHHEEPKYVMKLLQKSGAEKSCFGLSNKSIIPVEVPHMVQLHKFFETDSCIILLLEYLSYGRLWDFLRDYFVKRQRQIEEASLLMEINLGSSVCSKELSEPCSSSMICTPVNKNTTSFGAEQKKGAYKGRHICFSIGDSEDATDLAVAEEVVGSSKRASLSGGVTAYGNYSTVEEASRQLQLSYPAVGIKQTDDDIKIVEAEEEAPAPVDIHRVTVGDVEVSTLFEALKQAKLSLQQRRCWERHQIPEILIAYWMSQLCSAVYFLHSQGIVIRDLRPDNLLMDKDANLKLTFCSQWQCVTPCLDDCAIDDLYVAPEVTNIFAETTDAADRWSVGALLLELLCGQKLGEICLHGFESLKDLSIPDSVTMSFAARDLLSRLLVKDAEQRLSDDELRIHPFFEGVVNNDKVAPDRTQM